MLLILFSVVISDAILKHIIDFKTSCAELFVAGHFWDHSAYCVRSCGGMIIKANSK